MAQRELVARIEASLPMDGQECAIKGLYRMAALRGFTGIDQLSAPVVGKDQDLAL
jgi:hypothetical protein